MGWESSEGGWRGIQGACNLGFDSEPRAATYGGRRWRGRAPPRGPCAPLSAGPIVAYTIYRCRPTSTAVAQTLRHIFLPARHGDHLAPESRSSVIVEYSPTSPSCFEAPLSVKSHQHHHSPHYDKANSLYVVSPYTPSLSLLFSSLTSSVSEISWAAAPPPSVAT